MQITHTLNKARVAEAVRGTIKLFRRYVGKAITIFERKSRKALRKLFQERSMEAPSVA